MDSPPNLSGLLVHKNERTPNLEARHVTDAQDNLTQFAIPILISVDILQGGVGRRVRIAFRVLSIFAGQISITSILSKDGQHVGTGVANAIVLFECGNEPVRNRLFSALNSR